MKRLISFLLLIAFPLIIFAQANEVYNIIKVDGEIINKTTGKMLAPGDKIKPSDQLEFKDSYSTAVVISNARGKFTLEPATTGDAFGDTKLLAMAGNSVKAIDSRAQISTRAVGPTEVRDLSKYLGKDNFYIIGDNLTVKLSKTMYPLSPAMNIVFSYQGKTEKVSKKAVANGQAITIAKDQIVGKPEDLEKGTTLKTVAVYKFNSTNNQAAVITTVNIVFLDAQKVKDEFDVILPILKDQNMNRFDAVEYLKAYFGDVYGTTDPDVLYLTINQEVNKFFKQ
jgi:hypothetical protein